jgi:glutamate dehydrogenase
MNLWGSTNGLFSMPRRKSGLSKEELEKAIANESQKFKEFYSWLETHMSSTFFEEISHENLLLVTHNLINFHLQEYFANIYLKKAAIIMCNDSPTADLTILKRFGLQGIRYYRTFVSNEPLPIPEMRSNLRIAIIYFTETTYPSEEILPDNRKEELFQLVRSKNQDVNKDEFDALLKSMDIRFLKSMTTERLIIALNMFFRAKTRDHCQYEVIYDKNWEKEKKPSVRIVLAWKNVPKYFFLYRLAQTIYRYNLDMQRMVATYVDPNSTNSILIMSIAIHGQSGKAAWDEADTSEFLRELVTLKYFEAFDQFEKVFVTPKLITGNMANLLRCIADFVHQVLVHDDPYLYSLSNIEEGILRHPELSICLCDLFRLKFDPTTVDIEEYNIQEKKLQNSIKTLDTGHALNDLRRKNILFQAINFIRHILKTNFYRTNKTSLSFRLDPNCLNHLPYDTKKIFPELPFGIFFLKGMQYIGFHIRFKDLARGGLRTVVPEKSEQVLAERNNVFLECYNLAYTQQKKNKDIPEGGSKAVILLHPFEKITLEIDIFKRELKAANFDAKAIEERLKKYRNLQKIDFLHQAQKSFVNSLLTLVNCDEKGLLKAKNVIDYWNRSEYIYLGPDENMHNEIIEWIALHSEKQGYKIGKSFISSKPSLGINHKEYGVTSLGVNVYMEQVLLFLGINPKKDSFTVKISGGPDGDVAGNQILNLYNDFPNTAKLLALTDVSGTIFDPEGLDLKELIKLFHEAKPIRFYPPEKLNEDGFLLDLKTKKEQTPYITQTLCWKKEKNELTKQWLSGNEMQHLFRYNVHKTKTDVFIPAGGRPRTLSSSNFHEFLDSDGIPTSKAIIEGANLYLTESARKSLEDLGVIIIKDSSCNKGGVICSSLEVLSCLVLSEKEFLEQKNVLVPEILEIIKLAALNEARVLLHTFQEKNIYITDISESISEKINTYKYELLNFLELENLSSDLKDPLIQCLLSYCPKILLKNVNKIIENIPDIHKKAIIACHIAANLVYNRGLDWSPSIVDVLPLIAQDTKIIGKTK